MTESDIQAQTEALTALLAKAMGTDPGTDLPEKPQAFDAEAVQSWGEVAAALVAYRQGLPAAKKTALLARCKALTVEGKPNPNLTVQVARMPIFGGYGTRTARRAVQKAAPRRRTGLTRQGAPAVSMAAHRAAGRRAPPPRPGAPKMPGATATAAPAPRPSSQETLVSPQQLKLLEQAARRHQGTLEALAADDRGRPTALVQARRAWAKLKAALEARSTYLGEHGASAEAVGAYANAAGQIEAIIVGLR